MGIEFTKIDTAIVLPLIIEDPEYTGTFPYGNESEWLDETTWTWTDARPKPAWSLITAYWGTHTIAQGGGIDDSVCAPGDIKRSAWGADHGDWLYVHPSDGRTLLRADFPALFSVVGTAWNDLYSGMAGTDFGLPKPGGRMSMTSNSTHVYGAWGGADSATLSMSNIPEHDHDLLDDIIKSASGTNLGGLTALIGTLVQKIGSSQKTGSAGSANPTPVSTLPPYIADSNYFVYRGVYKYGVAYF